MKDPIKVLFVCVHNAARSRIAETYLKNLGGPAFEVSSAGFEPQEANPLVIKAMQRVSVPLATTEKQPSVFDLFRAGRRFEYVISVCDAASSERCPIFPGINKRISWSFPDPSQFVGTEHQRLEQVARVRDDIRTRIEQWLQELPPR